MAKEYSGKALASLSKSIHPDGARLCDQIAARLTDMTSAQVKVIDSALDFGWLTYQMRGVHLGGGSREDIANRRRAAKLLKLLFPTVQVPRDDSDSWEMGKLLIFIRLYTAQARRVTGSGFYLKGSFWAFSAHDDRVWTKTAWAEGIEMLQAGIRVATAAANGGNAQTVLARWFAAADHARVKQKLEETLLGAQGNRIGICYHGNGAAANVAEYQEESNSTYKSRIGVVNDEWGYASPEACAHNNIGYGPKFFDRGQTRAAMDLPHDVTRPLRLDVTRGGGIVHELTHRYGKTKDEPIPTATYLFLNRPQTGTAKGYGPYACHALAQSAPATALTNADSYRLFCEEAVLL